MVEFFGIILSRPLRGSLSRTLDSPSTPVSGQRGKRSLMLAGGPLAVRSTTTCWEDMGKISLPSYSGDSSQRMTPLPGGSSSRAILHPIHQALPFLLHILLDALHIPLS
jgi:hypothetical protein